MDNEDLLGEMQAALDRMLEMALAVLKMEGEIAQDVVVAHLHVVEGSSPKVVVATLSDGKELTLEPIIGGMPPVKPTLH